MVAIAHCSGGQPPAFLFDIGDRPAARGNRRQEVQHVVPDGRSALLLQVLLGPVFRVLLKLVNGPACLRARCPDLFRRASCGSRRRCAASCAMLGAATSTPPPRPSMRESVSHSETTSTGDTWIRRNRSVFPYHPQPIIPTRNFFLARGLFRLGARQPSQACGTRVNELATIHGAPFRRAISFTVYSFNQMTASRSSRSTHTIRIMPPAGGRTQPRTIEDYIFQSRAFL